MPANKKKEKGKKDTKKSPRGRPRKTSIVPDDVIILDDDDDYVPKSASTKKAETPRRTQRSASRHVNYFDGISGITFSDAKESKQSKHASQSAPRRPKRLTGDVELMMECVDDDLSPAQLAAIQLAKEEHEKANNLIKAARAGNTLVPSSQPNTFTVVPPTPKQVQASTKSQQRQLPPTPPAPAPIPAQVQPQVHPQVSAQSTAIAHALQQAQVKVVPLPTPPPSTGQSLPGPAPRTAQFMNKSKQAAPVSSGQDVIVIDEAPPMGTAMTPISHPPGTLHQMVAGATPQQVYKFVSMAGKQPQQVPSGQWVIRPIMTVPPQQQPNMPQGMMMPTPVQFVDPNKTMSAGSQTGKPSARVSPAEPSKGDGVQESTSLSDPSTHISHTSDTTSTISPKRTISQPEQGHTAGSQGFCVLRQKCVCSRAVFYKKESHAVSLATLFDRDKALQMYRVKHDRLRTLQKYSMNCHRKIRRKKVCRLYSRQMGRDCQIYGASEQVESSFSCDTSEQSGKTILEESAIVPVKDCLSDEPNLTDDENIENSVEICDISSKLVHVQQTLTNIEDTCDTQQYVIDDNEVCLEESSECRNLDNFEDMFDDYFSAGCFTEQFENLHWNTVTEEELVSGDTDVKHFREACHSFDNRAGDIEIHNAKRGHLQQSNCCSDTQLEEAPIRHMEEAGIRHDTDSRESISCTSRSLQDIQKSYGQRKTQIESENSGYIDFSEEVREILSGHGLSFTVGHFQTLAVYPLTAAPRNVSQWPLFTEEESGQNPITFHKSFHIETEPEKLCRKPVSSCSENSDKPEYLNTSFLDHRNASEPECEVVREESLDDKHKAFGDSDKGMKHEQTSNQDLDFRRACESQLSAVPERQPEFPEHQQIGVLDVELENNNNMEMEVFNQVDRLCEQIREKSVEQTSANEEGLNKVSTEKDIKEATSTVLVEENIAVETDEIDGHPPHETFAVVVQPVNKETTTSANVSNENVLDKNVVNVDRTVDAETAGNTHKSKLVDMENEKEDQKPWFHSLSRQDKSTIAELSTSYGVTKLAKLLHIPKTELMTWKRFCRMKKPDVNSVTRDTPDVSEVMGKCDDNVLSHFTIISDTSNVVDRGESRTSSASDQRQARTSNVADLGDAGTSNVSYQKEARRNKIKLPYQLKDTNPTLYALISELINKTVPETGLSYSNKSSRSGSISIHMSQADSRLLEQQEDDASEDILTTRLGHLPSSKHAFCQDTSDADSEDECGYGEYEDKERGIINKEDEDYKKDAGKCAEHKEDIDNNEYTQFESIQSRECDNQNCVIVEDYLKEASQVSLNGSYSKNSTHSIDTTDSIIAGLLDRPEDMVGQAYRQLLDEDQPYTGVSSVDKPDSTDQPFEDLTSDCESDDENDKLVIDVSGESTGLLPKSTKDTDSTDEEDEDKPNDNLNADIADVGRDHAYESTSMVPNSTRDTESTVEDADTSCGIPNVGADHAYAAPKSVAPKIKSPMKAIKVIVDKKKKDDNRTSALAYAQDQLEEFEGRLVQVYRGFTKTEQEYLHSSYLTLGSETVARMLDIPEDYVHSLLEMRDKKQDVTQLKEGQNDVDKSQTNGSKSKQLFSLGNKCIPMSGLLDSKGKENLDYEVQLSTHGFSESQNEGSMGKEASQSKREKSQQMIETLENCLTSMLGMQKENQDLTQLKRKTPEDKDDDQRLSDASRNTKRFYLLKGNQCIPMSSLDSLKLETSQTSHNKTEMHSENRYKMREAEKAGLGKDGFEVISQSNEKIIYKMQRKKPDEVQESVEEQLGHENESRCPSSALQSQTNTNILAHAVKYGVIDAVKTFNVSKKKCLKMLGLNSEGGKIGTKELNTKSEGSTTKTDSVNKNSTRSWSDSVLTEINKVGELVEGQDYFYSAEKHIYSDECVNKLCNLTILIGAEAVSDFYCIPIHKLKHWLRQYRGDELYARSANLIIRTFSDELKTKLVHQAKRHGQKQVIESFNIQNNTLRNWILKYSDSKLASYDLTDEDLQKLISYSEMKNAGFFNELLAGKRKKKTDSNENQSVSQSPKEKHRQDSNHKQTSAGILDQTEQKLEKASEGAQLDSMPVFGLPVSAEATNTESNNNKDHIIDDNSIEARQNDNSADVTAVQPEFPLLLPSEIKEEPIDEEFELMQQSYMKSSQRADAEGENDLNDGEIDKDRIYHGSRLFHENNAGLGNNLPNSQHNSASSSGASTNSTANSAQAVNTVRFGQHLFAGQAKQDSSRQDREGHKDYIKPGTSLLKMNWSPPDVAKDKEREKGSSQKEGRDVGLGASPEKSSPNVRLFSSTSNLKFNISEDDLEQQKALRNTLLALKSRKPSGDQTSGNENKVESKKPHSEGQSPSVSGRIESLIQGVSNRVNPFSLSPVKHTKGILESGQRKNIGSGQTPDQKSPNSTSILTNKADQVSLSRAFTSPTMIRTKEPSVSSNGTSETLSAESPSKLSDSSSEESISSTSSSGSSDITESSEDSVAEQPEKTDGSVNLSEKLKSLLEADIFSIVDNDADKDGAEQQEEEDLIELLASAGDKSKDVDKAKSSDKVDQEIIEMNLDKPSLTEEDQNLQRRFFYSLGLKQKLGKLAQKYSVISLSKRYLVNAKTLSKWKMLYQNVEMANLEFTEDEKEELRIVRLMKESHTKLSPDKYQIYIDNPEPESDEDAIEDIPEGKFPLETPTKSPMKTPMKSLIKTPVKGAAKPPVDGVVSEVRLPLQETTEMVPKSQAQRQIDFPKERRRGVMHKDDVYVTGNFGRGRQAPDSSVTQSTVPETNMGILGSPIKTSQVNSSPNKMQLYYAVSETDSDTIKETLRKQIKANDGQETQTSSGGVFTVTSESSVRQDQNKGRSVAAKAHLDLNPPQFVPITSSTAQKQIHLVIQSHPTISVTQVEKAAPPSIQTTIATPISSQSNIATPVSSQSKPTRTGTVFLCPIDGIFKYRLLDPELPAEKVVSAKPTPAPSTDKTNTDISEPSNAFKMHVVKEARKSGFENAARWYNIPMTNIMKWHDQTVQSNTEKGSRAEIVKHALNFGVIDASAKYEVSKTKIVEWLGSDLNEDDSTVTDGIEDSTAAPVVPAPAPTPAPIPVTPSVPTPAQEITSPTRTQKRGLSFDSFSAKEGKILKPRFGSGQTQAKSQSIPLSNAQKTRMGGKNIQSDIQSDVGIMPKFKKQSAGIEIASTWKQVQDLINPTKPHERKYSQDFKNRIIKECEERGQKVVSKLHKIPYNEISRWRLEAKRILGTRPAFTALTAAISTSSTGTTAKTPAVPNKSPAVAQNTSQPVPDTPPPSVQTSATPKPQEKESLKIKIKLPKKPENDQMAKAPISKKSGEKPKKPSVQKSQKTEAQKVKDNQDGIASAPSSSKPKEVEKEAPPTVVGDSDAEFRSQVVDYCIKQGVLKTQKHFNVTRQSVIDLMTEYDELNRYAVNAFNSNMELKTKLVSREKTSVEVGTSEPVIVTNLQDYIVTPEYMQSVADYAIAHGITAATRKFKRKSSTVKTWLHQFRKKEDVERVLAEQPKQQKCDITEKKKEIVECAKKNGITFTAKAYKKKAATIKSWMGHFQKMERAKKKLETNSTGSSDVVEAPQNRLKLTIPQPSQQTVNQSPMWDQDFVIKPNSTNSPLKLTLSPRVKSPIVQVLSDHEDVNDIETEDEWEVVGTGDFEEVATWDLEADAGHPSPEKKEKEKTNVEDAKLFSKTNLEDDKSQPLVDEIEEGKTKEAKTPETKMQVDELVTGDDMSAKGKDESPQKAEDKVEASGTNDILISPSDVPNILEMGIFKDMFEKDNEQEAVCNGNDSTAPDSPTKGNELPLPSANKLNESIGSDPSADKLNESMTSGPDVTEVSSKDDDVDDNGFNKDDLESVVEIKDDEEEEDEEKDEIEEIPYEKTVMFQLLNKDVDKFFTDLNSLNVTPIDSADDKARKTDQSKKNASKKTRRYADVEIMANIDETCIFSPNRPTRKITEAAPEAQNAQNETPVVETSENADKQEETKDEISQKKLDGSIKQKSEPETAASSQDAKPDECESTNKDDTTKENDQVSKVGKERSFFDFLALGDSESKEEAGGDEKKDDSNICSAGSDQEDASIKDRETDSSLDKEMNQKSNQNAPRSLFDSLFKNIKLPTKDDIEKTKALNMTANKNDCTVENSMNKNQDEKLCQDSKSKDRSERNVFDFMSPEPIISSASPAQDTSSNNYLSPSLSGNSDTLKPAANTSSLKPKPVFKFPKLQLPVKFGGIAKFGIAKKEYKTEQSSDTKVTHKSDGTITKSSDNICQDRSVASTTTTPIDDVISKEGKTRCKSTTDVHTEGIVMETFEELRKRLSDQRAKKREELNVQKADTGTSDTEHKAGDLNVHKDVPDDTDNEMYEDFTPQKIVLILDISKKHGIEFACTSFDLPASVIVNWIIDKDRKHRKIGPLVTLEDKLLAVQKLGDSEEKVDEISKQYSVSKSTLLSWRGEVKWLLDSKNVSAVLDKWQKVNSVMSLDESGKVAEKETDDEDAVGASERNKHNPDEQAQVEPSEGTADKPIEVEAVVINTEGDAVINHTECEVIADEKEGKNEQPERTGLPGVLSFVKDTIPRDFAVEQKAMIVLLMDKYGIKEVHRKLGINKGTLWTWKNQNKIVRQYLEEQKTGVRRKHVKKPDSPAKSQASSKSSPMSSPQTKRELRSSAIPEAEVSDIEDREEQKMGSNLRGYRYISPTKLPSSLKGNKKIPTKEYSLEQRVAIVKLVDLYGVRTVHKQFRIPAGSIWNWQHCKSVLAEMRKSEAKEEAASNSTNKAAKYINFDGDKTGADPFTIDLITERVLAAVGSTQHVKFKIHQKADVVCMVNHFGMDYVCSKLPSVPRGTMWNWCHNKNVLEIVESNMELLQKYRQLIGGKKHSLIEQEKVDKVMMTQKWLNSCQPAPMTRKRKNEEKADSVTSDSKKSRSITAEFGYLAESEQDIETVSGSQFEGFKRKTRSDTRNSGAMDTSRDRSSSSDSSVSSISGHSNDFEEILSDDDNMTPSIYSKRSGTSGKTSLISKTSNNKPKPKAKSPKAEKSVGSTCGSDKSANSVVKSSNAVDNSSGSADKLSGSQGLALSREGEDMPEYDVIRIEPGAHNRLMVFYQKIEKVGSVPPGSKRASTDSSPGPPAKKKGGKKDDLGETDAKGNWIPLDEYYYGTTEGDPAYTEEKGEFRFKCWYCSKMLYNNVRAMQHIQGHIDSSKQQNIDLSDLTQCKHCYKQFDTPFEMQTHVEKVHLSNKVLMCRICEKDFAVQKELIHHMRQNHYAAEMPYACQLCNFRSSMYSDVVDHFKKKHDASNNLLCLYCLRTFPVKFVSQGWGQTQTYYGHLMKHQTKSTAKKCVVCRLTFFNALDVKLHRKNMHGSNRAVAQGVPGKSGSGVMIKVPEGDGPKIKRPTIKSLNAPTTSKVQDYGGVQLPASAKKAFCFECKMTMSSVDHYKKHINCSLCRFATSCSVAYANHMMGFHSGQMSSLNLNIPYERPQPSALYCACGFSTKYGNKIANHLVFCVKRTCYSKKPDASAAGSSPGSTVKKGDGKKTEGSFPNVLGLVQKKSTPPRVKTAQGAAAEAKLEDKAAAEGGETTGATAEEEAKKTGQSVSPTTKEESGDKSTEKSSEEADTKADIDTKDEKEGSEGSPDIKADDKNEKGDSGKEEKGGEKSKDIEDQNQAEIKEDTEESKTKEEAEADKDAEVKDETKEEKEITKQTSAEDGVEEKQSNVEQSTDEPDKTLETPERSNEEPSDEKDNEDDLLDSIVETGDTEKTGEATTNNSDDNDDDDDILDDIVETAPSAEKTEKNTVETPDTAADDMGDDIVETADTSADADKATDDKDEDIFETTGKTEDAAEDDIVETAKNTTDDLEKDIVETEENKADALDDDIVETPENKPDSLDEDIVETADSAADGLEDDIVETADNTADAEEDIIETSDNAMEAEDDIIETADEAAESKEDKDDTESQAPEETKEEHRDEEMDTVEPKQDDITEDIRKADKEPAGNEAISDDDIMDSIVETDKKTEDSTKEGSVEKEQATGDDTAAEDKVEDQKKDVSPQPSESSSHGDRHDSSHHQGSRSSQERSHHDDDRHRHDDDRSSREGRYRDDRHHGDRSSRDDRYHGDRSYSSSHRSDSYHRSHDDRGYDRDRSHDRSHHRDDYRHGSDNRSRDYHSQRGQGYRGHQDRRGDGRDQNYNRNYGNRGGYNQNYRGGYHGGGSGYY